MKKQKFRERVLCLIADKGVSKAAREASQRRYPRGRPRGDGQHAPTVAHQGTALQISTCRRVAPAGPALFPSSTSSNPEPPPQQHHSFPSSFSTTQLPPIAPFLKPPSHSMPSDAEAPQPSSALASHSPPSNTEADGTPTAPPPSTSRLHKPKKSVFNPRFFLCLFVCLFVSVNKKKRVLSVERNFFPLVAAFFSQHSFYHFGCNPPINCLMHCSFFSQV